MPYLLLVMATLFWSGNFVISRGMHGEIPPFALSFWRWVLAFVIFAPFGVKHLLNQKRLVVKYKRYIAVQGILGVALFNSLIYLAVQQTTAINAALVNSCIPVLICGCSWLLYKETLSARQGLGVLLSLCGVVFIIAKGEFGFVFHLQFNGGDIMVLAAAFVWAFYSAAMKKYPQELHPFPTSWES